MVKLPPVSPTILQAITEAAGKQQEASAKRASLKKEADPKTGATEKQSIRPARTAIAHARGGNKGK